MIEEASATMTRAVGQFADRFAARIGAAMVVLTMSQFALAQELSKSFVLHDAAKPLVAIEFQDAQGQPRHLADFKGRVVVLNIWATWCVPCRREMPALDRLQAILGGPDFEVVPVSIDRGGIETVRKFFSEIGAHDLAMYLDASGQSLRTLRAMGLPTTLLIDRAGREIGRVVGPAEWDAPEIVAVLKSVVAKPSDTAAGLAQDAPSQPSSPHGGSSGSLWRGVQWLKALFTR
jgi:thiol-disulfide isomerase/thioredoxin